MKEQVTTFGFEKLEVWKRAVALAGTIYSITRDFPREELYGLAMQMRRAGVSVAANIGEGTSRSSSKDQARFFEIAYGSLNEIATLFYIALQQRMITEEHLISIRSEVSQIGKMLSGLRRSVME